MAYRYWWIVLLYCVAPAGAWAQTWTALDEGLNGPVYALQHIATSNTLHAGGTFNASGQDSIMNLARWNGNAWQAEGNPDDTIWHMLEVDNTIYLGGAFSSINNQPAHPFCRWNGNSWVSLMSNFNGHAVYALESYNSGIVVAGDFTAINNQPVANIAFWDGSQFVSLGSGLNGPVHAMTSLNGNLYVAGGFTQAGGQAAAGLAYWDGSQWHPMPGQLWGANGGHVNVLTSWYGQLYIGGCFDSIGGQPIENIAFFSNATQTWQPLGTGANDCVYDLLGLSKLYVGGAFTQTGTANVRYLAAWDGVNWNEVGGIFNGAVRALSGSGNQLFAGGDFTQITTNTASIQVNHVARLDLSTGIAPDITATTFQIYPNPAQQEIFLAAPAGIVSYHAIITNVMGQMVQQVAIRQPGVVRIDISHLSNGVYNIHLLEEDVRQGSVKLVIAR